MKYISILLFLALALPLAAQPELPITSYDYAVPENNVSPICIGMGGLNVTNPADFFASYTNPALVADNKYNALLTSFRLKDEEDLDFWQAAQISSALRPKQFKYFTLLAQQTAWTYQPMARVHLVEEYGYQQYRYYDYQLDKVQATLAGMDDSWQPIGFGVNLKYLTGRLVYQVYNAPGEPNAFIDDKIKGFSTDMGLTLQTGNMTFGLAGYDLFSRLYWENYDSVPIERRIAMGAQYNSENMTLSGGLQGKLSQATDTTYHLGFQYLWGWGGKNPRAGENAAQAIVLRLGTYSHDFYGTDNINFTLGTGYNYNVFRFDFSLNNQGMRLRDSEYLFSLGVGLP
jgi:hypothetical protein